MKKEQKFFSHKEKQEKSTLVDHIMSNKQQ